MTCIDSAIIKALVEHIGMNPDDVVVGGGGSTQNTYTKRTDVQFIDNNGKLAVRNTGTDAKLGDVIRVHMKDGKTYRLMLVNMLPFIWIQYDTENHLAHQYTPTLDSSSGLMIFDNYSTTSVDMDKMNNDSNYGYFDYDMKVPTGEDFIAFMYHVNLRVGAFHLGQ